MIKGVNLGNWLVLEKWMSPELFAGTSAEDEFHLCSELSEIAKHERFKVHRDAYITDRDFAYLARRNIELVRIPVPFSIFGDYEPYVGCIEYLDKAFKIVANFDPPTATQLALVERLGDGLLRQFEFKTPFGDLYVFEVTLKKIEF